MSDELTIDFKWMGGSWGNAFDNAFAAEIGVKLGDQWLTQLEELESRTTMTHVRACTQTLARWLAGNWWRLRWEPESDNARNDPSWRTAHSMANAGGGYAWPNIVFASDGESVAVSSFPRLKAAAHEPLRYLNAGHGRVSAGEFERTVDGFMNAILTRHQSFAVDDCELPKLWEEVLEERQDPAIARWRRLEALCGYDPDEAPDTLIKSLVTDTNGLGKHALEEVAAQGRHRTKKILAEIVALAEDDGNLSAGVVHCTPPILKHNPRHSAGMRPWERAAELAKEARKEWNLDDGIVSNDQLAELLGTSREVFADRSAKSEAPIPLTLRSDREGVNIYFTSSWGTSRRFSACRFLGHWLEKKGETERLIPATDVKTADQQFQRAFAQEFLCPYDSLKERLPVDQPSPDDIEDAANYFDVSPLLISTLLVNRGELNRGSLTGRYEPNH